MAGSELNLIFFSKTQVDSENTRDIPFKALSSNPSRPFANWVDNQHLFIDEKVFIIQESVDWYINKLPVECVDISPLFSSLSLPIAPFLLYSIAQ